MLGVGGGGRLPAVKWHEMRAVAVDAAAQRKAVGDTLGRSSQHLTARGGLQVLTVICLWDEAGQKNPKPCPGAIQF